MGDTSVLQGADLGYSEQLAIFSKPIQNVGVNDITFVPYYPVNEFTSQGVIEWHVPGTGRQYLDLSKTRLAVKCQVVKKNKASSTTAKDNTETSTSADGTDLAKVGPINNFLHSLWSRVDISLQDKLLTPADTNYSYMAYFKNLLDTSRAVKNGQLQSQLWYKDTAKYVSAKDPKLGGNAGLKSRSAYIQGSNIFDMEGVFLCDICQLDRFIPNGIDLKCKVYPTSPAWRLMSADSDPDYEVKVLNAILHVAKVDVSSEVMLAHAEVLQHQMAFFPYTKTEIKKFGLPKGYHSCTLNDPWQGSVPTEIIMGLVSESAEAGSYEYSPYDFENANLNYLQVTIDGKETPQGAIQPAYPTDQDATKGQYLDAYMSLFRGQQDIDLGISREDYPFGYAVYIIRIDSQTTPLQDPDFLPLNRKGNVRITLRFKEKLSKSMLLISAAKFGAGFKVDASRTIYPV